MKKHILISAILALFTASASAGELVLTTEMNGGTLPSNKTNLGSTNPFIIEDFDYDTGDATNPLLDIHILGTVTDLGGTTTQSFDYFTSKSESGLQGLGINSTSGNEWLNTDVGGNTLSERLTLTFFEANTSTQMTIDLGAGGAIAAVNNNGGLGAKLFADASVVSSLVDNTSYFANTSGITTFEAFADGIAGNNNTRFALYSLDIVDVAVIPEPSTFALFAGALGLGLVMRRRRR